ncbi:ACP synthase [Haloferax sp. Atlit-6N]|uniref:zinc ribbon domain-containing protein n=1 Tax=unclassified Haloferax TaxID=2625095 RepID=UPI000E240B49|nr:MULTISPECIES: zinc ribbon domain-containing protein [unclassified Haloferax]RDZ50683.1 ACP synthase [Haloferax sp. Atlit-4N]REA01650.1 ACP synthase [Haloferax sp. Atlit-6N]
MSADDSARATPGIAGVGAYVPRLSLPASAYREAWGKGGAPGVEQVAVADADEDTLTMATEAGRRALDAAGVDASDIGHLAFATTTPPNDEEESAVRLVSLLGVDPSVPTRQFGGSTRAGAVALAATVEATRGSDAGAGTGSGGPALVVVADSPRGAPESDEAAGAGAGAAALVLTDDAPLAVDAVGEFGDPAPGTRFREFGSAETDSIGVTQYERDAYTRAVGGAVEALGVDDAELDPDAVALTAPDGKLPYRAAAALGVEPARIAAGTVVSRTGDTGAAGPFLGLASALADSEDDAAGDESNGRSPATSVLLVGYGGGAGATALALSTRASDAASDASATSATSAVPVEAALDGDVELSYAEALRRRGTITGGEPAGGGAYVSVPTWKRTIPQRHRLVAGECTECGALSFPPEGACPDCGSLAGYDDATLPGTGTVEAATAIGQGGAPPEFVEQQQRAGSFPVAVVAFDGPDGEADDRAVSAPAQVVHSPAGTPAIGDRVEAVPRRIYEQEGVVRYGFKVVPTEARRE